MAAGAGGRQAHRRLADFLDRADDVALPDIYFIPFFFVYNPALLLQGAWGEILIVCATAVLGIVLLGSALQGYMVGFGRFPSGGLAMTGRTLLGMAGITCAAPGGDLTGLNHLQWTMLAAALTVPDLLLSLPGRRRAANLAANMAAAGYSG